MNAANRIDRQYQSPIPHLSPLAYPRKTLPLSRRNGYILTFLAFFAGWFHVEPRQTAPISARELKEQFKNAREPKVREILAALASIGQAREMEDGRYVS